MRRSLALFSAVAALVSVAAPASASMDELVGQWRNADPNDRGITQVSVRTEQGQLLVRAWAKCSPRDCDWGEVQATAFAANIRDPIDAADKVIAEFDSGGSQRMLLLETSKGTLSFKVFTIFQNGNRTNYHSSGHLVR